MGKKREPHRWKLQRRTDLLDLKRRKKKDAKGESFSTKEKNV